MALRRALTLYRWANSISKGVSRERGGGFTVTEMTLEFSTVVFLGQSQQVSGEAGGGGARARLPLPVPPLSASRWPTPPPMPRPFQAGRASHLCRARKLPRFL